MTTPREEQPATAGPAGAQATPEQAAAGVPGTPQVITAPPRARWRFGGVPARLGRARTSTVVLAVVWVLVALLWLDVRPPSAQIAPTGDTGPGTGQTATTTTPARTSSRTTTPTPAPASTTTPAPTTGAEPSATSTAPASSTARSGRTTAPSTSAAPTASPGSSATTPALPTTASAPSS
jgi:hypothetical protein